MNVNLHRREAGDNNIESKVELVAIYKKGRVQIFVHHIFFESINGKIITVICYVDSSPLCQVGRFYYPRAVLSSAEHEIRYFSSEIWSTS